MPETTSQNGRVIVRTGEGTEGTNTVAFLTELELAADAFGMNVLDALPFDTVEKPSATAVIDKVLTITEAKTVVNGNPSARIDRSSGGSRSVGINLSYKMGQATEEWEYVEEKTSNRNIKGGAMIRVAEGCERYLTGLLIDTLDNWFTADQALSSGKNPVISAAVGYTTRSATDVTPANYNPVQTAAGQPMNFAKIIAANDIFGINVSRGMFSQTRILIGPYRSLVTQLRGDPAVQHADWRPENNARSGMEVVDRSTTGPSNSSEVYMGMFGGYKICAIPNLGGRAGPFKSDRTEADAGTADTDLTGLTTTYMLLDNAIINYKIEGFPNVFMNLRDNTNYELTRNLVGLTNLTPNIYFKEHIVPILNTQSTNPAIATGAIG